jgi:hypothetical protein
MFRTIAPLSKSIAGILRMSDVFSQHKKVQPDDSFAVDWLQGTLISVNGTVEREPVNEPEFDSTLMRIWLGNSPADPLLKEGLAGRAPTAGAPGTGGYN